MNKMPLYEEIINEIGTQSLAKLGLNIFSLNTYNAYGASVSTTNDTLRAYNRHKNNENYFGQTFEELDIGMQNIKDSLFNTGNKTYTTDTLSDIKKVQDILASGKKIENLSQKDQDKLRHILANYQDELENFDFTKGVLAKFAQSNHTTTDTITLDKNGEIVKSSQLKVIKNTNDLLKDRYLEGDGAVDELKVPFDDYKKHRENLEAMIKENEGSDDPKRVEKAQKAKIALEKLNQNNLCNRLMCENPRASAVIVQSISGSSHIIQAGASDAIVVALSTLANALIWEIKDLCQNKDSQISILDRIKRLINKVLDSIKHSFVRGASFGAIDAIMGIIGQIFKTIAADLKRIYTSLRTSAKSIYNALFDYSNGKIKTMQEFLSIILKALFSAVGVIGIIGLEAELKLLLPFGALFAPLFAIVATAFAIVMTHKSIDLALDSFFSSFFYCNKAKIRAEEIAQLVCEKLPVLIEERQELEILIESTHKERLLSFEASFADYEKAYTQCDGERIFEALNKINKLYYAELKIKDMNDVKELLENPNRSGKLQY